MTRRTLLAVLMALAVVAAAPGTATAAHNSTKVHTTDADFNAGTFEGNVSVDGSGDDATLVLHKREPNTTTFQYTGSEQTYSVPSWVTEVTIETWGAGGGDGGSYLATSGGDGGTGAYVNTTVSVTGGETLYVYVGGQGGQGDNSGGWNGGGSGDSSGAGGGDSGGGGGMSDVRQGGNAISDRVAVAAGGGGGGGADEDGPGTDGGDGQGSTISGTGSYEGGDGTGSNNHGAGGGGGGGNNGGQAGETGDDSQPGQGGKGGGSSAAGTHTTITGGGGNTGNGQVAISYEGTSTPKYVSANYSVEDAQSGFVNVTRNTDANLTVHWQGWTGSQWTTLNRTTGVTTTGNVTYPFSSADVTKVRANLTSQTLSGSSTSTLEVASEGVDFQTHTPTVDNQSASPQNGTLIQSSPETLSIPVNDTDFAKSHGDTVDVEFFVNESSDDAPRSIGTDTLQSNGTASISYAPQTGGNVTWFAWANDSYGHTQQSDTFNLTTPSGLTIRSETNGSKLITGVDVELQFYINESDDNATIVTRNTTTGKINMAGLPVNRPFVVVADADGYRTRRVFIEDLFTQQRVYLLNDSEPAVETIFRLEDYTGDFPDKNTVLIVQNAINGSYQTVLGDFFGATGEFSAKMHEGERHRLILYNIATEQRLIEGTFTPITASTQTITVAPGEVDRISDLETSAFISPDGDQLPPRANVTLRTIVQSDQSVDWSVSATLTNDSGTTTVWSNTTSGAGELATQLNLTNRSGATINVTVQYTVDGETTTVTKSYAVGSAYPSQTSLLEAIGGLASLSPEPARSAFTTFLAMVLVGLVMGGMGSLGMQGEVVGVGGVLLIAFFAAIGWLSYGLLFTAGVGLFAFAAVKRGL